MSAYVCVRVCARVCVCVCVCVYVCVCVRERERERERAPWQNPLSVEKMDTSLTRSRAPPINTMGPYRGTSPIRKCLPLEPYRRPLPMILGGS